MTPPSRQMKILLVGGKGVGKSALLRQVALKDHEHTAPLPPTVGFEVGGERVSVKFIEPTDGDITGIKVKSHARTADAVVFLYDINKEASYKVLGQAFGFLRSVTPEAPFTLVGTKSDLKRKVSKSDAKRAAELQGMQFMEVSATSNENCHALFEMVIAEALKGRGTETPRPTSARGEQADQNRALTTKQGEEDEEDLRSGGPSLVDKIKACFGL